MNLVKPFCACCGTKADTLAVVMDPFSDSCYGLCRTCIGKTYAGQVEQLREQQGLWVPPKEEA